jgi:hypothetical protein
MICQKQGMPMMNQSPTYRQVLEIGSQWPDAQRFTLVQDVLKTLEPEARPRKKETLPQALGLLEISAPPHTNDGKSTKVF